MGWTRQGVNGPVLEELGYTATPHESSYVRCDSQERHSQVVVLAAVGSEAHHLDWSPGVLIVAVPKLT